MRRSSLFTAAFTAAISINLLPGTADAEPAGASKEEVSVNRTNCQDDTGLAIVENDCSSNQFLAEVGIWAVVGVTSDGEKGGASFIPVSVLYELHPRIPLRVSAGPAAIGGMQPNAKDDEKKGFGSWRPAGLAGTDIRLFPGYRMGGMNLPVQIGMIGPNLIALTGLQLSGPGFELGMGYAYLHNVIHDEEDAQLDGHAGWLNWLFKGYGW